MKIHNTYKKQMTLLAVGTFIWALTGMGCANDSSSELSDASEELVFTYIGMNHTETDVNGEDWIGNHHTDVEHSIQRSQNGNIYRFEVHEGEARPGREPSVERAELGHRTNFGYGDEVWISYSVNMNPGETPSSRWVVTGQMHGSVSSPPMSIGGRNDTLFVQSLFGQVRDREVIRHYKTPWDRGEWYHIIIRQRHGVDNDAILQTWINGELVVDETENFNMGYIDDQGNIRPDPSENPNPLYWKYGIYRQTAPQIQSMKVANMEVSSESLMHRVENPKPIIP